MAKSSRFLELLACDVATGVTRARYLGTICGLLLCAIPCCAIGYAQPVQSAQSAQSDQSAQPAQTPGGLAATSSSAGLGAASPNPTSDSEVLARTAAAAANANTNAKNPHPETAEHDVLDSQPMPDVATPALNITRAAAAPAIDPDDLVLKSVQQSVWGPAFTATFRQRTAWFEKQQLVALTGQYTQAGRGTGQLRLETRYSDGADVHHAVQVSDGRLLWSSYTDNEPLRYVNLDTIRQVLSPYYGKPAKVPELSLYLAIGGQPEVLRSLYLRYQWYQVQPGTVGSTPVWQLIGRIRTQRPIILADAPIDSASLRTEPSPLVPSTVRLTLTRGTDLPYFPLKIEYFRRASKKGSGKETQGPPELVSVIEYLEPKVIAEIPVEFFQLQIQNDLGKTEESQLYIPPASLFQQPP